uniref:Polysaccharide deactylase family protein, PEP-CTERM locus subfamily n=1 Tax=Desulfovibrio sp. U5L TaxID=596152 RepID=I2Q338_9BACT
MLQESRNALTVDVEDYFHVSAFEGVIRPGQWGGFDCRVAANTRRILALFDEYDLTATFFVLGWVARRHPDLVRDIAAAGHEIACHGFGHKRIRFQTQKAFRRDVAASKALLEDIAGRPVLGYRAPSYSITPETAWALDVLIEEGFAYDSSIFPIVHDLYGFPGASPHPHRIRRPAGEILEFPPTTLRLRLLGRSLALPISGGGYLRLFPAWFLRWGLARVNRREGQPGVLYFHPWEIDPGQPRISACLKSRFRHYLNLDKTEDRLRTLFEGLSFGPMGLLLAGLGPLPAISLDQSPTPARMER